MHTSAQPFTQASQASDPRLQYDGQVIEPVSLEFDPRTGVHSLRIVMRPLGCVSKKIVSHVPVEPGEGHTAAAQKLADRINRAVKQGRDAISVSARSSAAVLVLPGAALVSHEEPEREEAKPAKAPQAVDLLAGLLPEAA